MARIYLPRRIRVIWVGSPFIELDGFWLRIWSGIRSRGGDPVRSYASTDIYSDSQPDVTMWFGNIGILENTRSTVRIGAGPIPVRGKDGNRYELRMSQKSSLLAENTEAVVTVEWQLTGIA